MRQDEAEWGKMGQARQDEVDARSEYAKEGTFGKLDWDALNLVRWFRMWILWTYYPPLSLSVSRGRACAS
jgi:hypothetical protein